MFTYFHQYNEIVFKKEKNLESNALQWKLYKNVSMSDFKENIYGKFFLSFLNLITSNLGKQKKINLFAVISPEDLPMNKRETLIAEISSKI